MSDSDLIDDRAPSPQPARPGPALVWGLVMVVAVAGAAATALTARTGSREVVASSIDTATADRLERELRRLSAERDAMASRLAQIERGVGELKIVAARAATDPVVTGSIGRAVEPQKAPKPEVTPPARPAEDAPRKAPAASATQIPAEGVAPQDEQASVRQAPSPAPELPPTPAPGTPPPDAKPPATAQTASEPRATAAAPAAPAPPVPAPPSPRIAAALARSAEVPAPAAGDPLQILPAPKTGGGFAIAIGWERSKDGARRRWSNLSGRYPRSLAGLSPRGRSNRSGEAVELLAGPFASKDEAAKVCAGLAASGVPCNTTALEGDPLDRS